MQSCVKYACCKERLVSHSSCAGLSQVPSFFRAELFTMACILHMQKSFKDVRCVNAGTIPLPKHGRQIEVDPSEIHDEEVQQPSSPLELILCPCKLGILT